jgi:formate/nitrite transporter
LDHNSPTVLIADAIAAAEKKSDLPVRDLLLRGALAGVILSYATSLAMVITTQGVAPIVAAAFFPCGFVVLVLLGLELATGNFAVLPIGVAHGRVTLSRMLRNWWGVSAVNLIGSVLYAVLFYLAVTNFGTGDGGALGNLVRQTAQKKTLAYMAIGGRGWLTAFVKGILCNWMVAIGAMLAMISRSTIGKITAMWLPIMIFFAQGYEHSIVNMFAIPAGMLFGAPVSAAQWWWWNQIPVTLGNIVAGAVLTGLALAATHRRDAGATTANVTEIHPAGASIGTAASASAL